MANYLTVNNTISQYGDWMSKEKIVRAFLVKTNQGMIPWFDDQQNQAEREANAIPDPEFIDASTATDFFLDRTEMWPSDYLWQLSSSVIKEACSLYEIYLENTANDLLNLFGASLIKIETEDSWKWGECKAFYECYVGVDVRPLKIDAIIWMRNKLTHLRDELRTDEGKKEFSDKLDLVDIDGPPTQDELELGLVEYRPYMSVGVQLSQLQTLRVLDLIVDQVAVIDQAIRRLESGGETNQYLESLKNRNPLPVPNFNVNRLVQYSD